VAWAYIMDNAPVMSNPFEYRQSLWEILYEGERPKARDTNPRAASKALTTGEAKSLSRKDSSTLNDMRDKLAALAAAKGRTERRPPMPRPAPEQT